jgi:Glucosidase II beta subunit-like protein
VEFLSWCSRRLCGILLHTGVQSRHKVLERATAQREGTVAQFLQSYSPNNRSQLDLTCGTENILLTVTELEKCEYLFTGTTPALCLPLEDETASRKDEL